MCFSSMFCHGYMPIDAAHSVMSPVVKDKSGAISDSANYRPIALVTNTIFSKILEHIIVSRIDRCFVGSHNQFGFKKYHSTVMPVLILKDIINVYLSHGSNMHLAVIDISKAFDRVRYDTLFIKLSKFISGATLRLLIVWYASHTAGIFLGRDHV